MGREPMQLAWVVSPEIEYEGLGSPVAVFTGAYAEIRAHRFVAHEVIKARKAHRARPDYAVSEVYVDPPTLSYCEAEDKRRYKEAVA